MSLSTITTLRRELDALAVELAAADPQPRWADLLRRARTLRQEASTVGITVLAGAAALREGEILLRTGAATDASAALTTAADLLEGTGQTDLRTVALARLSDALMLTGDMHRVLAVATEGITLVEQDRYKTSAPYLQAGYLRRTIALYTNGVTAAHAVGDGRALAWTELSKSRVLPAGPDGRAHPADPDAAADPPAPDPAALEARLDDLSQRIDRHTARGRETTPLRRQRRILFDRLAAAERRATRMPDFDLDEVQSALSPDQRALSYYWLGPGRLLVAVVAPGAVVLHDQEVTPAAHTALSALARAVQGTAGALDPDVRSGLVDHTVARLAPVLLPPPVREAITGARRLLVSPHRALHTVPFGALPVDGAPLVRRAAVASIPNLTCLQLPAPPARPPRLLAAGAAHYAVPGLAARPLPQAEDEATDVAAAYRRRGVPAEALVGPAAVETTLHGRCRHPDAGPTCLHLALHGASVESDTPLESWLLLPGSRLDGLDLARWRLPGATVVLSACSSGQRAIGGRGMAELPGDDLLGLQAAFFAAGARQVLGALWPVDDGVARRMTAAFHARLLEGDTADVALQRALVAHLDGAGLLHGGARYWAPFYLSCMGAPIGIGRVG